MFRLFLMVLLALATAGCEFCEVASPEEVCLLPAEQADEPDEEEIEVSVGAAALPNGGILPHNALAHVASFVFNGHADARITAATIQMVGGNFQGIDHVRLNHEGDVAAVGELSQIGMLSSELDIQFGQPNGNASPRVQLDIRVQTLQRDIEPFRFCLLSFEWENTETGEGHEVLLGRGEVCGESFEVNGSNLPVTVDAVDDGPQLAGIPGQNLLDLGVTIPEDGYLISATFEVRGAQVLRRITLFDWRANQPGGPAQPVDDGEATVSSEIRLLADVPHAVGLQVAEWAEMLPHEEAIISLCLTHAEAVGEQNGQTYAFHGEVCRRIWLTP